MSELNYEVSVIDGDKYYTTVSNRGNQTMIFTMFGNTFIQTNRTPPRLISEAKRLSKDAKALLAIIEADKEAEEAAATEAVEAATKAAATEAVEAATKAAETATKAVEAATKTKNIKSEKTEVIATPKAKKKRERLSIRLSKTHTSEEIHQMIQDICNDPESKKGATGINIYNKKAMKKMDELSWAIYYRNGTAQKQTPHARTYNAMKLH